MKTIIPLLLSSVLFFSNSASAREKNGFNLDNSTISADQIFSGGPPRDGIPSIDKPKFLSAKKATYLKPNDRVIGIEVDGEARAYPIRILNWHEIVNDKINGQAIAVTFCPLCGSGVVYSAEIDGKAYQFGVSGLLYNSDVLLYDRQTKSLWSQILSKGISGKMVDQALDVIDSSHTSWQSWKAQYPDTKVLSKETGFSRDYNRSPYAGYTSNENIFFPLAFRSKKYHPKERVLGITINGMQKVYPFSELAKALEGSSESIITDSFEGETLSLNVDVENRDGNITNSNDETITSLNTFWFSWYAFHPETAIFKAP